MVPNSHFMKNVSTKPINILIPNATSPKNPGDQAILNVLIDLVKNAHPSALITVHSTDPHLYSDVKLTTKHTLYSWSVFEDRKTIARLLNVSTLLLQYLLLRNGVKNIALNKSLSSLIADYERADLILFLGGGYLRSKKGIKQALNLSMHILLFKYAALFKARKIVGPISVGPFRYAMQERAVVRELRKVEKVAIREHISHAVVKKYKLKNTVRSADHAFLLKQEQKSTKKLPKRVVLGFTLRHWLEGEKQVHLEKSVVSAIEGFVKATGAKVQPIVQVDASEYGEDDAAINKRIARKLQNKGIDVLPVKRIRSVNEAMQIYNRLDLLLGMRMHANIFAAHQGVPFVAISYEHKTEGIARELAMGKYCVSCEEIDGENLSTLLIEAFHKRKYLGKRLKDILKNIQKTEATQWNRYLGAQ